MTTLKRTSGIAIALFIMLMATQMQAATTQSLIQDFTKLKTTAAAESFIISTALTDSSIKNTTKQELRNIRNQLDNYTDAMNEVITYLYRSRQLPSKELNEIEQVRNNCSAYLIGVNIRIAALGLRN